MRLIVHVGDMKTGTTSIQAALAAGNIPRVGLIVAYPGDEMNHNDYAQALAKPSQGTIKPRVERLRRMIAEAAPADICILSAEALSNGDPATILSEINHWLVDLADGVEVIQYARPHFGYLTSRYVEAIKTGAHDGSLEEWITRMIAEGRHRICRRADIWAEALGDRFTIRPFLRGELARGDAVADFFQNVLGPLPEGWTPPPAANETLPPDAVEALRILHRQTATLPRSFRAPLGRQFATLYSEIFGHRPAAKVMPAPDLARRIHEACAEDAEQLDARHFGGRGLMRAALDRDLQECLAPQRVEAAPLTAAEITALMGRLICDLAQHMDVDKAGQQLHRSRQTVLTAAASLPVTPE